MHWFKLNDLNAFVSGVLAPVHLQYSRVAHLV